MGQKSNLVSLRFFKSPKCYSRLNFQEFLYSFLFLKFLKFLFFKKKLFLTNSFFFFVENKIFLTCFLFFRVVKLSFFNKLLKKQKKKKKKKKKKLQILAKSKIRSQIYNKFNKLKNIFNSLKFFRNNIIIFTFINLNIYLKKQKKKIFILFKYLKKSALLLFPRRFNFLLDFIQLSILFIENKIEIKFFISIICEIFRILQKKMHSKFFIFINKYFKFLLTAPLKSSSLVNLLGIKFCINGKLKGKPRSNNYMFVAGTVPIQSINASIDYSKAHAFTIYGVFGIKIWVYRK